MEVPEPEIESKPQLWPTPQLWQWWILNLLYWAGDWTSAATQAATEKMPDPFPTAPQGNFSIAFLSHYNHVALAYLDLMPKTVLGT